MGLDSSRERHIDNNGPSSDTSSSSLLERAGWKVQRQPEVCDAVEALRNIGQQAAARSKVRCIEEEAAIVAFAVG
jgi:hypothetical protein